MDFRGVASIICEYLLMQINKMSTTDLKLEDNYTMLTNELRVFNEKICVVEINIKVANENDYLEIKTRKIQSNL